MMHSLQSVYRWNAPLIAYSLFSPFFRHHLRVLLLTLLILTGLDRPAAFAQQTIALNYGFGLGSDVKILSVATDASGYVYVTGDFSNTVDFAPGPGIVSKTSLADQDIFIARYSPSGTLDWVNHLPGTGSNFGLSIAVYGGKVYTSGYFTGTVDFNPDELNAVNVTSFGGSFDAYLAQYDATTGSFGWINQLGSGSSNSEYGYSVAANSNGVFLTGYFEGTGDFNPSGATFDLVSAGGRDIFLTRYNLNGTFGWAKRFGNSTDDLGLSVAVDASNIYITGAFQGTADFDPDNAGGDLTATGLSQDIFLAKYSASGDYQWAKRIGNSDEDRGQSVAVDGTGVYLTGYFQGTDVNFNPSGTANLTSAGQRDIFLAKYDLTTGDYSWANRFGGTLNDEGRSLAVDGTGVYLTGEFRGTNVDFDPGAGTANLSSASSGLSDVILAKYNTTNGNYIWANRFGGTGTDIGTSVAVDATGRISIGGDVQTSFPADFDPSSNTVNADGGFLANYRELGITTSTLSSNTFCAGATVSVPFTATQTFNSGNVFTAQLSDASGSFTTTTAIGSLTATSDGAITATIPTTTAQGTGYRIRVVSSNPAKTGTDNGTNLTIYEKPSLVGLSGTDPVCVDKPMAFSAVVDGLTLPSVTPSYTFTISQYGTGCSNCNTTIVSGYTSATLNTTLFANNVGANPAFELRVATPAGCTAITTRTTIVNPTPTVSGLATTSVCLGTPQVFTANVTNFSISGGITTSYNYTLTNGTAMSASASGQSLTLLTVSLAPVVSGTTTYTLTVAADGGNCPVSTTVSSVVNPSPAFTSLTTTAGSLSYCSAGDIRDIINISATVTDATAYTVIGPGSTAGNNGGTVWTTFGSSASATGSLTGSPASFSVNREATVPRAGSYTLIVTNASGCRSTTTISLSVATSPTISATALTASQTICQAGQPVTLTVAATGGSGSYSYTWEIGPGTSGGYASYSANSTTISTSVLTTFTSGTTATRYRVRATDQVSGCETETSISRVDVRQTPTVTLASSGTVTCNPSSVTLTASATGGVLPYSYTYSGPGLTPTSSSSSLVVDPAQEGLYSVTVSAGGCATTATTNVLSATGTPTVTITPSSNTITCATPVTLTANATAGANGATEPFSYTFYKGNTVVGIPGSASTLVLSAAANAGSYSVVVSAANGCTGASGVASVSSGFDLTLGSPVVTHQSCYNGTSGAIVTTATDGTGNYSYSLTGGGLGSPIVNSTGNFGNLTAATSYFVTVSDEGGCTAISGPISVTQPDELVFSASAVDVACNGGATGIISVTISGGTAPFTISAGSNFSAVFATAGVVSLTGIPAGQYGVFLTDANDCEAPTVPVSVTQPDPLTVQQQFSSGYICAGESATLTATPTGGTAPFTFSYVTSSGTTVSTSNILNIATLPSSVSSTLSYTVIATDANGCTAISGANFDLFVRALPTVSIAPATTAICVGQVVSLTANASGGTAISSYSWSPDITANSTNELTVSPTATTTYTVMVGDGNLCSNTATATVTVNQLPTISTLTSTSVACAGGNTGSFTVVAGGGAGSYTFTVNSITNSTGIFTGLSAGIYPVSLTDAAGCSPSSVSSVTISEPTALSITGIAATSVTCFGNATGGIAVSAAGGASPYSYSIESGVNRFTNSTGTFTGIPAGTYSITVADANNCQVTSSTAVNESGTALLISSLSSTSVGCNGASTGSISATVSGGIAGYTLSVGGSNSATVSTSGESATIIGLSAGSYTLTVTDANGCSVASSAITLSQPSGQPTVTISPSYTAVCAGNAASLTATVSGGVPNYTFAWSTGTIPGSSSMVSATTVQTDGGTTKTYSVTVTDGNGCTAVSNSSSLTVNTFPTATISASPSTTITCAVPSVTLVAGTGSSYVFTNSSGTPIFSTGNQAVVSSGGTFSVIVTSNGCSSTTSIVVDQSTGPGELTLGSPATASAVCEGGSVVVPVSVSGTATGFQWYRNGSAVAGQTSATLSLGGLQAAQAGNYVLVATSSCGSVTTNSSFSLTVGSQPTVVISFPSSSSTLGLGTPTITISPDVTSYQVTGGVLFERTIVIDRINGYEIRQFDSNTTGLFAVNRLGLFTMRVTDSAGCQRTVQGILR